MVPAQPPPILPVPLPQQALMVQPGRDAASHAQALKTSIASSLTDLYGVKMEPFNLTPPQHQPVAKEEGDQVIQKTGVDWDLEDFWAGVKGTSRTEPSKNFLSTLLGRLQKQHPDKDLKME